MNIAEAAGRVSPLHVLNLMLTGQLEQEGSAHMGEREWEDMSEKTLS